MELTLLLETKLLSMMAITLSVLAQQHLDLSVAHLFTREGDVYTHRDWLKHDTEKLCHVESEPNFWPRGQSWGLLGASVAASRISSCHLSLAERCCERWWQKYQDNLPLVKNSKDIQMSDPSAAVIAVIAMFKLADLQLNKVLWQQRAHAILTRVIRSSYLSHDTHGLRFTGCHYQIKLNQYGMTEMAYGYFFLLQALLIATNKISAIDF